MDADLDWTSDELAHPSRLVWRGDIENADQTTARARTVQGRAPFGLLWAGFATCFSLAPVSPPRPIGDAILVNRRNGNLFPRPAVNQQGIMMFLSLQMRRRLGQIFALTRVVFDHIANLRKLSRTAATVSIKRPRSFVSQWD